MARLTGVLITEELVFPVSVTKIIKKKREISIVSKIVTLGEHNFCKELFFYTQKFTKERKNRVKLSIFTIFENSTRVLDSLGQKKSI